MSLKTRIFAENQHRMKYLIFLMIAAVLGGCSKQQNNKSASISGEFKSLRNDTILFYGADNTYPQVDTILVKKGKFHAALNIDTLTCAYLYFTSIEKELPIYINKEEKLNLTSTNADNIDDLKAEGNESTKQLYEFLTTLPQQADSLKRSSVKEFILNNPYSYADIYLIDRFFMRDDTLRHDELREITSGLSGLLQDTPYITRLTKYLKNSENVKPGKIFPFFNLPSNLNKKITRMNTFHNKMLVVHFWASWDTESRSMNKELRQLYNTIRKKKDVDMLGISFDTDKKVWQEAIEADSMEWTQAYVPEGFYREAEQSYAITQLPTLFLLKKTGHVKLKSYNLEEISDSLKVMLDK